MVGHGVRLGYTWNMPVTSCKAVKKGAIESKVKGVIFRQFHMLQLIVHGSVVPLFSGHHITKHKESLLLYGSLIKHRGDLLADHMINLLVHDCGDQAREHGQYYVDDLRDYAATDVELHFLGLNLKFSFLYLDLGDRSHLPLVCPRVRVVDCLVHQIDLQVQVDIAHLHIQGRLDRHKPKIVFELLGADEEIEITDLHLIGVAGLVHLEVHLVRA